MHDRLNSTRSIQTIRDCTTVFASQVIHGKEVQVRTLDNEAIEKVRDFHFIVTFKDDVENATFKVKPLTEAAFLNNSPFFLLNPMKQYPEFEKEMASFCIFINTSIFKFLADKP